MHARSDNRPAPLEVQALYSIAALARSAKVSTDLLRRVLRSNRVELVRGGRALFVPLSEIRSKVPSLWKSICLAEDVREKARGRVSVR